MNNYAQKIKSDLHYVGPYVYIVVQAIVIQGLLIFVLMDLVSRHLFGLWSRDKPITRPLLTWDVEGREKQIFFHDLGGIQTHDPNI
jgi:hypothetical protein